MGNALSDLALGLRQAAGVLNPDVQKETFAADTRKDELAQQRTFQTQQMLQQFALQQATPQAAMQRQQLEDNLNFRKEIQESQGDETKMAAAAMKYGKPEVFMGLFNAKEKRVADAQARRETLDQRMTELQMRIDDKALSREQQAQYQQMMGGLKQQQIAMQGEAMRGRLELQGMRLELTGRHATDKAQADAEKAANKQTQQLGVALEKAGIPTMDSVVRGAEQAVAKDDVLQYLSGPKSVIPDMFLPKDAQDATQAIRKLFNITLKDRSGAAVTNQELERLKGEFGQGVFKKPEQLREAVNKARDIIEAHGRAVAAGYGPTALKAYNDNLKEVGGTPLLEGRAPTKITGDADFAKLPSGAKFIGPDGVTRTKP